jgi:hypothetical protein
METKKPIKQYKAGVISVSAWKNESDKGEFITFSLQRAYKQGEEWKHTQSFRANDLPKLISLLQESYDEHVRGITKEKSESYIEPEEKI